MKIFNFLLLVIFTVLLSCDDDSPVDTDNTNNIKNPPIESYGRGIVEGVVKDGDGQALSGVRVYYGNVETTTNASGYYKIDRLSYGNNKRVWFEKEGYVSIQKLVQAKDWNVFYCDVTLLKIAKTTKLNNDGGKIVGENFSIEFPPGIFVDSEGLLIVGDVSINVTPFLKDMEDFTNAFPGRFGNDIIGYPEVNFLSFGFIDLEINQAGEEIFFADGVTAKISIKAPNNVPLDINLRSYDENEGVWNEGNKGTYSKGLLIGEIEKPAQWTWVETFVDLNIYTSIIKCNSRDRILLDGVYIEIVNLENGYKDCSLNGYGYRLTAKKGDKHLIRVFKKYYRKIETEFTPTNSSSIDDICLEMIDSSTVRPLLRDKYNYRLTPGEISHIYGENIGDDKSQLELFIDGNLVDFNLAYDELYNYEKKSYIEFIVPNNINLVGEIQIRRGTQLSNKVSFIKTKEKWTIYNPDNCIIPSRRYSSIIESRDKTIWVGTYESIGHFDGTSWESIRTSELGYYKDAKIRTITEASDGTLWFGCGFEEYFALKYDGINAKIYDDDMENHPYRINSIVEDNNKKMWFGTGDGLRILENEKWVTPLGSEKLKSTYVSSIIKLDNDNMWIGTSRGLYYYNGETYDKIKTKSKFFEDLSIRSMFLTKSGNLVIGSYLDGLSFYDGINWTIYNSTNSDLPCNNIWSIEEDKNDNLWISSYDNNEGYGVVSKFNGIDFIHYSQDNCNLPNSYTLDIKLASDGKLWIATGKGLAVLENY